MSFVTREMRKEDIPSIIEIIGSHSLFDAENAKKYFEKYFNDSARLLSDSERNYVVQDVERGTLIGICGFSPDKYDHQGIMWLNWLYVKKEYIGKSIGFNLLNYTREIAKSQSIRKIYLDTSSDSVYRRAIKLYKNFGFKQEGELINYYDIGEHYIIMGLEVN